MSLPNPGMNFTPFDTLPASDLNDIVENIEALSTGSGFAPLGNNVVPANALTTSAITLGYAQITSNFTTTSTTPVQVTGLTLTVTIPAGGRRIKITAYTGGLTQTTGSNYAALTLWDGTVGSGTQLTQGNSGPTAGVNQATVVLASQTPSAGSKTYNVGLQTTSGTAGVTASATNPAFILVEAI